MRLDGTWRGRDESRGPVFMVQLGLKESMTMTITLSQRTEERLKTEAAKRGLDASAFAAELIDLALPSRTDIDATLAWLEGWDKTNATNDPDEIARREKEFEEFKEGMNRNRQETEGANARKIFP
jgi:hypothetical protein